MLNLPEITLLQYINLESDQLKSDYDFFVKYSKKCNTAKDLFDFGEVTEWTFEQVKDLQYIFEKEYTYTDICEYISKRIEKNIDKITSLSLVEFWQLNTFLKESIEKINEIEKSVFDYKPSNDEIEAGCETFSKFGTLLQFDQLAGGCIEKYDLIGKLKYSLCFSKLVLEKERSEFNERLFTIRNRKK